MAVMTNSEFQEFIERKQCYLKKRSVKYKTKGHKNTFNQKITPSFNIMVLFFAVFVACNHVKICVKIK